MKRNIVLILVHYASLAEASSAPSAPSSCMQKQHHQHPSCRSNAVTNTRFTTSSNRRGFHACFLSNYLNTKPSTNHHRPCSSIHKQWEGHSRGNHCLFVSRSTSTGDKTTQKKQSNKSRGRKNRKNGTDAGGGANMGRRMKKTEIDDLVRVIGLEPVTQATPSKKKKKTPSINVSNTQQMKMPEDIDQTENMDNHFSIIQSTAEISLRTQLDYSRQGHALLRSFLPHALVQQLRSELLPHAESHVISAWRQKVEVQLADSTDEYYKQNAQTIAKKLKSTEDCQDLLESLGMDPLSGDLPFLQHFNTWRAHPAANISNKSTTTDTVRKVCLSPYLAQAASILLDTSTVRLYQDSLFHKRVGDGWTPWHSDARMAPFDTSKMITFWIPLQKVPAPDEGGTGLLFVDGSHSDFALPYWNGAVGKEYDRLENRYGDGNNGGGVSHHMPMKLGDVTVHNGWTLHCADAAEDMEDCEDRYAFSVTYVDGRAEVREDVLSSGVDNAKEREATNGSSPKGDREDVWSFRSWVEEVDPRIEFRHPLVPIVWPSKERDIE